MHLYATVEKIGVDEFEVIRLENEEGQDYLEYLGGETVFYSERKLVRTIEKYGNMEKGDVTIEFKEI